MEAAASAAACVWYEENPEAWTYVLITAVTMVVAVPNSRLASCANSNAEVGLLEKVKTALLKAGTVNDKATLIAAIADGLLETTVELIPYMLNVAAKEANVMFDFAEPGGLTIAELQDVVSKT